MPRYDSQRWGVIGAGASGVAAAAWLAAEGAHVLVTDDDPVALEQAARRLGDTVEVRPSDAVLVSDADRWVLSPGVPPTHPLVATVRDSDRGCADLDLWQEARPALTVAVTGTNGKSTVCAMLQAMFERAGFATVLGANFGTPVGKLLLEGARPQRAVLEVSSFQLMYARTFTPEVAIVTNLAPDHMDWHRDMAEYRSAKERIAAHMTPEHLLVLPEELADFASDSEAMRVLVGERLAADQCVRGALIGPQEVRFFFGRRQAVLDLSDLRERLPFVENAVMAAFAAWATGVDTQTIAAALRDYVPLAHRFEIVADREGVLWINDSKATNLHAMLAAIRTARRPVRLLAGGKEKGLDWSGAIDAMRDTVVRVYAYGETAEQVRAAWADALDVQVCETIEDAVRAAAADVTSGEAVLLAPGTSSFDQFSGYAERGQAFRDAVAALHGEGGGA